MHVCQCVNVLWSDYLLDLVTDLEVSVLGLYPDKLNRVEVTLDYEGGQKVDVIEIQTEEIPAFFPSIRVNKLEKDKMEPGMHAMDIHFANFGKFRSAPIIFALYSLSPPTLTTISSAFWIT